MSRKKFGGFNDTPGFRLKKPRTLTDIEYSNNGVPANTWKDVAIEDDYILALDDHSKVYTWGQNNSGQLGLSVDYGVDKDSRNWKTLSHGYDFTIALREDGSLWSWGRNNHGQLGDGTVVNRSSPVQIGTKRWIKIAAGYDQAGAIREDGYLFTWGNNTSGALGDLTATNKSSPIQVGFEKYKDMTGLYYAFVGQREDETMWSWGFNSNGELGVGNRTHRTSPTQVLNTAGNSYTSLTSQHNTVHLIRSDGTMWGWGYNGNNGNLGDGTTASRSAIVQIGGSPLTGFPASWISVKSGPGSNAVAKGSDGYDYGWGLNTSGQLGIGNTTNMVYPIKLQDFPVHSGKTYVDYFIGDFWIGWLDSDSNLYMSGYNNLGQLPHETFVNATDGPQSKSSPVLIGNSYTFLGGRSHVHAIKTDGTLWGWGSILNGSLGNNSVAEHRSSPVQIKYIEDSSTYPRRILHEDNFKEIASGKSHSLVVNNSGKLFGWGSRAGLDTLTTATSWKQVSVGEANRFSVALRSDGKIFTWGLNTNGELGLNDRVHRSSPTQIPGSTVFSSIETGWYHTMAIDNEGILWNWGFGTQAQIYAATGNEFNPVNKSYAGQVRSHPHSWIKVASGNLFTVAVRSDYTLWGWGQNTSGQLGLGTITAPFNNLSSPVQIAADKSWVDVAAGDGHTVGITTNPRALWTWGRNTEGQLGIGTVTAPFNNTSSPTQIPSILNFPSKIAASGFTTYFTNGFSSNPNSGSLFATGRNTAGEIGDSTVVAKSSPVFIASNVSEIYTGYLSAFAKKDNGTLFAWGANDHGLLGVWRDDHLGSIDNRSYPYAVGMGAGENVSWTKIGRGSTAGHSMGIKSNGTLWAWGLNSSGQLGLNDVLARSSPVQVGGRTDWTNVVMGGAFTLATRGTGTLWAWGQNTSGQLGINNITAPLNNTSSPIQVGSLNSWVQLAAGEAHSIARRVNSVFTWGANGYGQLGTGNIVNYSSPVQIATSNMRNIDAGRHNSMYLNAFREIHVWGRGDLGGIGEIAQGVALNTSSPVQVVERDFHFGYEEAWFGADHSIGIEWGTRNVWAWGLGTNGQLGDGTAISKSSPVQIGLSASRAASGSKATLVIESGTGYLWAWGTNGSGQLGNGVIAAPFNNVSSPIQIGSDTWSKVAMYAWSSHALGIKTDGTLWAWGNNNYGQLGQNNRTHRSSPVQIGTDNDWEDVFCGIESSYFRKTTGELWGVGRGSEGQMEHGNVLNRSSPVFINSESWTWLTSGHYNLSGVKNDGTLWSWGYNNYGQLGTSTTTSTSSPVQIGDDTDWYQVEAGESSAVGIKTNGAVYSWGRNNNGQLGLGRTNDITSPTLVVGKTRAKIRTNFTNNIAPWRSSGLNIQNTDLGLIRGGAGQRFGVVADDRSLYVWGLGSSGQLGWKGPGISVHRSSPVQVALDQSFGSAYLGEYTTYALSDTFDDNGQNKLWAWGYNNIGQLGHGDPRTGGAVNLSWPVQVGRLGEENEEYLTVSQASDGHHIGIIRDDGALFVWGYNFFGHVGNGFQSAVMISVSSPVQIMASKSWSQVATGYHHTLAIQSDGSMWSWGDNTFGQLGLGNRTRYLFPQKVPGSDSWTQVKCGRSWTVAVKSDGTAWSCGLGGNFSLGTGDGAHRSSFTQVATDGSFTQITAGQWHAGGIKTDGSLWMWGFGGNGQIGAGNVLNYSSPVQVGSDYSWSMVAGGQRHTAAIRSDGMLFTWGLNTNGELGNGYKLSKSSPVQIGFSSWNFVYAQGQADGGEGTTFGIKADGTLWGWGRNNLGQLARGDVVSTSSPVQIGRPYLNNPLSQLDPEIMTSQSWKYVGGNQGTVFAIRADNTLWAWGRGSEGTLGQHFWGVALESRSSPVQISVQSFTNIDAGNSMATARGGDGNLYAWGENTDGRLGVGNVVDNYSPTIVRTMNFEGDYMSTNRYKRSWSQIGGGSVHNFGITNDGRLWAWGAGANGVLGVPTQGFVGYVSSPTQVGTQSWNHIASGYYHTVGVKGDGTLWSWGYNVNGECGQNFRSPAFVGFSSPVQIGNKSAWLGVGATRHSSYATEQNYMYAWGWNNVGQLGLGERGFEPVPETGNSNRSSPVLISTFTTGRVSWTNLKSSSNYGLATHTVAIDSEGSLFTWGLGTTGQLGVPVDMFVTARSSPIQVQSYQRYNSDGTPFRRSWTQVSAGKETSAGITTDGLLFAWGADGWGQLGQLHSQLSSPSFGTDSGIKFNTSSPIQIGIQTPNFNPYYSDASNPDTQYLAPMQNPSWTMVSIGESSMNAIRADGKLFGWGYSAWGNTTPLNNIISRSSPTQVGSDNWKRVKQGRIHTFGIKTDGTLWTWGYNLNGQLGDGTVVGRSSPVQIGNRTDWVDMFAAHSFSGALDANGYFWTWGLNNIGQLGHGNVISKSSPVQVGTGKWKLLDYANNENGSTITGGDSFAMGIRDIDGPVDQIFSWGLNSDFGQLGLSPFDKINRSSPTQIGLREFGTIVMNKESDAFYEGLSIQEPRQIGNLNYAKVAAGDDFSIAISSDKLYTWGNAQLGQMGNANRIATETEYFSPAQVGNENWKDVVAGQSHAVGVKK